MKKVLDRKRFAAWLRRQDTDAQFRRNSFCSCPLAEYIGSYVGPDKFYSRRHIKGYPLPDWAVAFVEKVDASRYRYITARDCLRVLETT